MKKIKENAVNATTRTNTTNVTEDSNAKGENKMKKFMTINEAAEATGLSTFYLRNAVKTNAIPFIYTGVKYLINVPQMLELLDEQSRGNCLGMKPVLD